MNEENQTNYYAIIPATVRYNNLLKPSEKLMYDEIKGPENIILEENAGDITKGGKLDGSKEKPYEINCIEDLVSFSITTNGRKYWFGIGIKRLFE